MKILILGVTGMLGHAVFRSFEATAGFETWGTMRSSGALRHFPVQTQARMITGLDVLNPDDLASAYSKVRPEVVINCVGLVKQLADSNDPVTALPINAMLPHRLARLCDLAGARLVHISTDCVFSGRKGRYTEAALSDAEDLYGKSKFIGELHDLPHAITLRTSIIGHELNSAHGLVGWFLAQHGRIQGYTKAIFSGLPTCELAAIIRDVVLPRPELHGLYHVASQPIAKFDLLQLINQEYGKDLLIEPDDRLQIDRSLDASRFRAATGYVAPAWPQLIAQMRAFQ